MTIYKKNMEGISMLTFHFICSAFCSVNLPPEHFDESMVVNQNDKRASNVNRVDPCKNQEFTQESVYGIELPILHVIALNETEPDTQQPTTSTATGTSHSMSAGNQEPETNSRVNDGQVINDEDKEQKSLPESNKQYVDESEKELSSQRTNGGFRYVRLVSVENDTNNLLSGTRIETNRKKKMMSKCLTNPISFFGMIIMILLIIFFFYMVFKYIKR